MFRMIRRGIVATLALAALIVPAAQGQTDSAQRQIMSHHERAEAFKKQGKPAQAAQAYEQAVDLARRHFGPEEQITAALMNDLANLYMDLGRYGEAEPLFRRSLAIREKQLGRDHPDVAQSLNNLALLYRVMGRYAEAEPLFRRSLEIQEKQLGRDHPHVATSLDNLAALYYEMGRYAEAEPLYCRSLEIREKQLGRDHPHVAESLNNLADLYRMMGRYAEAEPLYRRSLAIREKQVGRDHPHVADSLTSLAILYGEMGRYAEAEPLYRRSLAIREKQLGRDHPRVAQSLNNLANLYRDLGRDAEAEPLYHRSLEIQEKQLGRDHPLVAQSLNNLALLYRALGRYAEAAGAIDRERRVVRRHVGRVLPALAEAEQLAFLKANDEHYLHVALSLALVRRDDPEAVGRSTGWVLNGKAVAQEALAQRALLARDRNDPAAARLATVRNQLAALTLAVPKTGQEGDRLRALHGLTAQERELSKQVGQNLGRPARDDPWVAPDEVRRALPADAVLVEIARFKVGNFQAKGAEKHWGPPHYAAWVIPPAGRGEVRLIDLGEADAIEAAVDAVRRAIQPDVAALRQRGEPEVEAALRQPLEALAARVLRPLLPQIGEAKRWVLSPDAALWLVPWAALPLDQGRYAIEDHQISYVVSGRDLVQAVSQPVAGQALVMADPDYDLDPAAVRQAARQVLRGGEAPSPDLALRGLSRSFQLGSVARLPGTATEAKAIEPKLLAFAGVAPVLYTDRWALESVFKAFQRPRVVLLSTHGFFLDDQKEEPRNDDGRLLEGQRSGPKLSVRSENPLLRCGLLLAGCNRPQAGADEDGVLTGLEIVGTDLRGTELVVLSACETGLGQVRNGEGVAGLRQAFQLAGAQTVVATLWQVPDKESARLMITFFDNLASGQGKAEALRAAQLALIRSRRERYGAAHPFFWAAFTVTGEGF